MNSKDAQLIAVDFETDDVQFFNKKNRKELSWSGHPRLAQAMIVSNRDETACNATENIKDLSVPDGSVILFHNAAFDIQVGINSGVWCEHSFKV